MFLNSAVKIQNFLAADGVIDTSGAKSASELTEGGIFSIVQNFFTVAGVIIVLYVLWKIVKAFAQGNLAGVAKLIFGGVFASAMCFDITLPITLVSSLSGVVTTLFETLGNIGGD